MILKPHVPAELHRFLLGLDAPVQFREWFYAHLEAVEACLQRSDFQRLLEVDFGDRHAVGRVIRSLEHRVLPLELPNVDEAEELERLLVRGDDLQSQGDPRGELIMLQASLLRDGRNTLSEAELLAMHEQQLLGELAPLVKQGKLALGWFMGWIASARFAVARPARAREAVRALLRHPSGFRLRALEVSTGDYRPVTEVIAQHPASLTTIVLDEGDEGLHHRVGDLGAVMRAQPSLRSIEVNGSGQQLGPLPPALLSLILRTRELHRADVEALASEPAPALERLELWIGEESEVEPASLVPLLSRERLPNLRHLALPYVRFGNELVQLLLASDLLPGLVTLDLSRGGMTALGCGVLTENARRFAHLAILDLRHHELQPGIAEAVSRALPNARTRDQQHNDYRRLDLREPRW